MLNKSSFGPRFAFFGLLAGVAVLASTGCGAKEPTATTAVYDPSLSKASSSNLLELYSKLDKVYEEDMAASDAKIDPAEKEIVGKLQDPKADVKADLAKNHRLFADGIETTKKAQVDLSTATSPNVDPMEHDNYVAYYAAIGELLAAKRADYEAILAYEAKPTADNRAAVLLASKTVVGKKLIYAEKKR